MSGDLRIRGFERKHPVHLLVNGKPVTAYEGETLHAALIAAGILSLKTSRVTQEPRGVFCGMGVCHECLVTINGVTGIRACMTLVQDGMKVETHEP
jgi:predicted molibdopterin-dependent oxidoreductase YjgC